MFQNTKANRRVYFNNVIGSLQIIIGGFCSFVFGLTLIGCFNTMFGSKKTTEIGATSIILIIFILSVYILNRGLKRRRLNRIYCTYTQQLMQNSAFSIDQLALVLRMPLNSVRKDLETMVKKGFIDSVNQYDKNYNQHSQNYRAEKPSATFRTQTVSVNGKVVSESNPEVEAMMDNMQGKFGKIFGEGNTINVNSDPEDIAKFVENTLRMAGISETGEVTELEGSSPSFESQPRVFECKSCGARNMVVPEADAVCEYCGSGLE